MSVPLPDVPDDVPLEFEPFGVGFWFVDVEPFGVVVVPAPDCPELLVPDVDPSDGVVGVRGRIRFVRIVSGVGGRVRAVSGRSGAAGCGIRLLPGVLAVVLSEFVVESLSVSVVPDWFCILSCVPLFPLP